jgi:hypothetical protein
MRLIIILQNSQWRNIYMPLRNIKIYQNQLFVKCIGLICYDAGLAVAFNYYALNIQIHK